MPYNFFLPEFPKVELNEVLFITGWGPYGDGYKPADNLLTGQVFLADINECKGDSIGVNGDQHICCKSDTYDACIGDTGGELW